MKFFNRHLVTVYATQEFLDWVKQVKPAMRWDLAAFNHRPAAYMLEIEDQNCHGMALEKYYRNIIERELGHHQYIPKALWPEHITFELFSRWFTYQYHEEVYDLSEEPLDVFDE